MGADGFNRSKCYRWTTS